MTTAQKVIQYLAIAFAIFLTVTIIGGILSAVGFIGGFFTGEDITGEIQTYSVDADIQNLNVVIKAADVHIKEGDAFSVESSLKNLKVEEKDGRLIIKDTTEVKAQLFGSNTFKDAVLTLYIPEGAVFDHVSLTTGAGRLTVDHLSAGTLDFELGAGEVTIGTLVAAKSADIEGGAGQITVSDGAINNLDLEMGVGQFHLTSALTGDCQLDSGVGEMNITLLGSKDDYKLELEKGLGSISVDGKDISDHGNIGNGTNKVEIHGGVGAINVDFKELGAK